LFAILSEANASFLPQSDPFQEYDDAKFRQRFRLSKIAVTELLDEIIAEPDTWRRQIS